MKIKTTSSSQIKQVTSGSRQNGKLIAYKAHQATEIGSQRKLVTDVMTPTPNSNSLYNGSQIKYFLEAHAARNIQNITLRFKVTNNNANPIEVPPVSKWFDRIEIFVRNSGKEIVRLYDDILHMFVNRSDKDVLESHHDYHNQNAYYGTRYGDDALVSGQSYLYLPLNYSFFEGSNIDLSTVSSDIEIRMHPSNALSSFTDLQLDEVSAVIEVEHPDLASDRAHKSLLRNYVVAHTFVDSQQYIVPGVVMLASSRYEFDLDQYDDKVSALLMCIRPTGSKDPLCMDLCDGTWDVVGVSGESLYGNGRPVVNDFFRDFHITRNVGNDYFAKTKQVLIPFGQPLKALQGVTHGYHTFDGSKKKLQVNTPSVGTAQQFTLTVSAQAEFYKTWVFRFNGEDIVCYDGVSNITDLQNSWESNINAVLFNYNLKIRVSSVVGTVATITVTDLNGQPTKNIKLSASCATQLAAPENQFVQSVSSVAGWVNASYDVTIYALIHKVFKQHLNQIDAHDV